MVRVQGLHRPNNSELPYFAYGPFKPGQIGFHIIKYFVRGYKEVELYNYGLGQRNGTPMLFRGNYSTKGYILFFNNKIINYKMGYDKESKEYDAYDFIRLSKSKTLYKWNTIRIGNDEVNIMLAKDNDYCSPFRDDSERYIDNYDGKSNKMFYKTLEYLYLNLKKLKFLHGFDKFINLQMNYMFLWSSIDNFLSLGYGGWDQRKHIIEWSKWDEFRQALENNVHRRCSVKSAQNSKKYKLNSENPSSSIQYYYQFRCNVVHNGKENYADFSKLRKAYEELLYIFWDVLDLTFYGRIRY